MFKIVTIATIASMAVAEENKAALLKKTLGPKCTLRAKSQEEYDGIIAGDDKWAGMKNSPMAIDMLKTTNKNGKCKIEKIDDIMCPKLAEVDNAKYEDRQELGEKVTKCIMQCALC